MFSLLRADLEFNRAYELTGEFLAELGIKVLIADLDNTLAMYENEVPDDTVIRWAKSLSDNGISLAIVSNNKEERVKKYCEPLGIDYYWKSKKPSRKTIRRAMEKLGGTVETTALVGDKFVTDIIGAKRCGILSIKVKPLGKRRMFE